MANKSVRQRRIVLGVTDPVSLILMAGLPCYLESNGWRVNVVVGGVPPETLRPPHYVVPMRRNPSPLHDIVALLRLVVLLREARPDVVCFGTPKAGLLGTLASRLAGIPTRIYLLRGLRAESLTGRRRWMVLRLEWIAMRSSTVVLAVSPSLRDECVRLGLVAKSKIVVLGSGSSNGVDTGRFRPPDAEDRTRARARWGIPEGAFVVGFVGRITADKGLDTLVEAMASLGDNGFLMAVGSSESETYRCNVQVRAAELGVRLVLTGGVQNIASAYHAMDIFCLPSLREGFPNAVLEASSSGLAVVVSGATGCRDSVVPGLTGLTFDVGDASGLADRIALLARSHEVRIRMGRAGRTWVVEEFERSDFWKRHSDFLDTLLIEAPPGARRGRET